MTSSMMPGTVLAGRYQLEDLLDDIDGARFWRATDTVLARSVAVHAIDESDPRVAGMLEAARLSATVTDPHLLRVLDADLRDGIAWVINEWGHGRSLDEMISQGVLPPDRAAWLVREVASAIAVAHGGGLAHGRLAPENVMVTESGTVRLIGFAIDAQLQRGLLRSGNYPQADEKQADVLDLAGLLYTGLVGCWPGASGSLVKAAPRNAHGLLRPRQVRAGVPRPLDAICDRLLAHATPNRSAYQLAAVLTEYIGDPAVPALVPGAAAGSSTDPPARVPVDDRGGDVVPAAATDRDATDLPADDVPWDEDPDATQQAVPAARTSAEDDTEWHQPRPDPPPPAPSLEPLPERPLFAPEGTRRTPKGAVPRSETSDWGTSERLLTNTGTGSVPELREPDWPFGRDPEEEPDDWEARTSRHWLRLPIVVVLLAVLAVIAAVVLTVDNKKSGGSSPSGATSPSASARPTDGQPIKIVGAKDLDPYGDPPEENPDEVGNAIDGDPATTWTTLTYRGRPDLGGLKPGVGLALDLGSVQNVGSVTVDLVGSPTDLVLYAAPTSSGVPTGIEGLDRLAAKKGAGERVVLTTTSAVRARYVVVWLTSLPPVQGGFRGEISDITARS